MFMASSCPGLARPCLSVRQVYNCPYSQIRKSSDSDKNSNNVLGISVPIKGFDVSGNASSDQRKAVKKALEQTEFSFLDQYNSMEFVSLAGDKTIVENWQKCVAQDRGGIFVDFEAYDSTTITLSIRARSPNYGATIDTRLDSEIKLPIGFSVETGRQECLEKGTLITAAPCVVGIRATSAEVTMLAVASTPFDSDRVYLPPRLKIVEKTSTLSRELARTGDEPLKIVIPIADHSRREFSETFVLPSKILNDEWVIDPVSVVVNPGDNGGNRRVSCIVKALQFGPQEIQISGIADNNHQTERGTCTFTFSPINLFKFEAVPIGWTSAAE